MAFVPGLCHLWQLIGTDVEIRYTSFFCFPAIFCTKMYKMPACCLQTLQNCFIIFFYTLFVRFLMIFAYFCKKNKFIFFIFTQFYAKNATIFAVKIYKQFCCIFPIHFVRFCADFGQLWKKKSEQFFHQKLFVHETHSRWRFSNCFWRRNNFWESFVGKCLFHGRDFLDKWHFWFGFFFEKKNADRRWIFTTEKRASFPKNTTEKGVTLATQDTECNSVSYCLI